MGRWASAVALRRSRPRRAIDQPADGLAMGAEHGVAQLLVPEHGQQRIQAAVHPEGGDEAPASGSGLRARGAPCRAAQGGAAEDPLDRIVLQADHQPVGLATSARRQRALLVRPVQLSLSPASACRTTISMPMTIPSCPGPGHPPFQGEFRGGGARGRSHRLSPAGDAELAEDAVRVGLDGVQGDDQVGGDLLVRHQAGEVAQHGLLSLGEVLDQLGRGHAHLRRLGGRLHQLVDVRPEGRDPLAVPGEQRPGGRAGIEEAAAKPSCSARPRARSSDAAARSRSASAGQGIRSQPRPAPSGSRWAPRRPGRARCRGGAGGVALGQAQAGQGHGLPIQRRAAPVEVLEQGDDWGCPCRRGAPPRSAAASATAPSAAAGQAPASHRHRAERAGQVARARCSRPAGSRPPAPSAASRSRRGRRPGPGGGWPRPDRRRSSGPTPGPDGRRPPASMTTSHARRRPSRSRPTGGPRRAPCRACSNPSWLRQTSSTVAGPARVATARPSRSRGSASSRCPAHIAAAPTLASVIARASSSTLSVPIPACRASAASPATITWSRSPASQARRCPCSSAAAPAGRDAPRRAAPPCAARRRPAGRAPDPQQLEAGSRPTCSWSVVASPRRMRLGACRTMRSAA